MRASYLYGPLTFFGVAVAAIACLIDQASKLYLLFVFDTASNPVHLGPFFDFVLTRNTGISYGLFQTRGRLTALSLGLIIGGAVGNAIDRLAYGWVADFVFFHVSTANWRFNWYVFNLADGAIVAGVMGLLYESLAGDRAQKAP